MRAQAKLEKLKEEIAESVKKAGMEAEIDSTDKAIKVSNTLLVNLHLLITVNSRNSHMPKSAFYGPIAKL